MTTAVLFTSHFITDSYLQRYFKLAHDLEGQYDVYWLFQTDNGISDKPLRSRGVNVEGFTIDDLNALDYSPISTNFYGSEHFMDEAFFHKHPHYDYYWLIEYDVVFSGNWQTLFQAFCDNDADMLTSHIAKYCEANKNWELWPTLSFGPDDQLPKDRWVKAFNPIHRYSRRALQFLDGYLKHEGNSGFSEAIVSTALHNHGFRLEDFGGTGEFVAAGNRNRFYVQGAGIHNGTMRWRPEYLLEEIDCLGTRDKLFHPIKQ